MGYNYDNNQLDDAKTIIGVGNSMHMSPRDEIVALQTALDEGHLHSNPGSLGGSYGLFQQTPAAGWGSINQVMNPTYASTQFYNHLNRLGNRNSESLAAESQDVQRSGAGDPNSKWYQGGGYGGNYARFSTQAQDLYNSLTGQHQDYSKWVGKMPTPQASAGSRVAAFTSGIASSSGSAPHAITAPSTETVALNDAQFSVV